MILTVVRKCLYKLQQLVAVPNSDAECSLWVKKWTFTYYVHELQISALHGAEWLALCTGAQGHPGTARLVPTGHEARWVPQVAYVFI